MESDPFGQAEHITRIDAFELAEQTCGYIQQLTRALEDALRFSTIDYRLVPMLSYGDGLVVPESESEPCTCFMLYMRHNSGRRKTAHIPFMTFPRHESEYYRSIRSVVYNLVALELAEFADQGDRSPQYAPSSPIADNPMPQYNEMLRRGRESEAPWCDLYNIHQSLQPHRGKFDDNLMFQPGFDPFDNGVDDDFDGDVENDRLEEMRERSYAGMLTDPDIQNRPYAGRH